MGRSCGCQSGYTWVEQWKWKDLIHKYEEWRAQIINIDGHVNEKTPLPLQEERRYFGKKTLAQVCQEQLRIRPFVDLTNPQPESVSDDEEPVVDEYGNVKKVTNRKSKQWLAKHKSCHFCLHRHPKWKMAFCSSCDLAYCYGTLFRAHDMMPVGVMEAYNWKCPHCLRVCNTGACRRDPRQHPYEPKGTLLGHDTKKVADVRSVECLVDFSVSNLNWLREEDGMAQNAMQRRMQQAEMDKLIDPSLDARFIDEDERANTRYGITYSPVEDNDGGLASTSQIHDANGDLYYPEPSMDGEIPRLGQKRTRDGHDDVEDRRRKKTKAREQKKDELQSLQPRSVPGKQYQKEVQKKLLEDAKREDRLILVTARMKGKSKIVKLSLAMGLLDRIRQSPVSERTQVVRESTPEELDTPHDMQSILQSDVMQQSGAVAEKGKEAKTYRVRVEDDGTYSARKRNPEISGPAKPGRPRGPRRFEEFTLDSDEEFADEEGTEYVSQPRSRKSTWLARRTEGDEDLPTELPPNFRDGTVRPGREKDRERNRMYKERRQNMAAQETASIRPSGKPTANLHQESADDISGNASDEDGIHEEDTEASDAVMLAQQATAAATALELRRRVDETTARAEAATEAAEEAAEATEAVALDATENLRAETALFPHSDDDNQIMDSFSGDIPAEGEPSEDEAEPETSVPEPVRNGPPQHTNSILSGLNGKKIKIVGSSNRSGNGPTNVTAPQSQFTPVNKKAQPINISDTESEDEVPATAPAPKRPVGRPPGRPAMKPTRGLGYSTRGRGRPRGRPRKTT